MTRRFVGALTASAQLAPAVQNCSLLPGWRLANLDPTQYTILPTGAPSETYHLPSTNNVNNKDPQIKVPQIKVPQIAMLPEDACDMAHEGMRLSRKRLWEAHPGSYTFRTENCWANPAFKWFKVPDNSTGPEPNVVAMVDDGFFKSEYGLKTFRRLRKGLAEQGSIAEVGNSCPKWRDICGSNSPPDLPSEYKNCTLPSGYSWLRATDPRKRTTEWFAAPNGGGICRSRTLLEAGALMSLFPGAVDLRKPHNSRLASVVTSSDTGSKSASLDHDYTFRTPRQLCGVGPVWEVSHLEPPPCKEPEGQEFERIGYKEPRWVAIYKENRDVFSRVRRGCTGGNAEAMDPHRKAQLSKKALADYELERTRMQNAMRNQTRPQPGTTHPTTTRSRKSKNDARRQQVQHASVVLFSQLVEDTTPRIPTDTPTKAGPRKLRANARQQQAQLASAMLFSQLVEGVSPRTRTGASTGDLDDE